MLAGLCLLSVSVWAHPDLLAQIEALDARLQQQPEDAELLMRRGDLYRRHEDYAAARRDFAAARQAQPELPLLDFYQGRLALETGEASLASSLLNRYLASQPQHAGAWVLLAEAEWAQQQPVVAAGHYQQAITRSPTPTPALYRQWSLALAAAGPAHWTAAGAAAAQGLERFPADVSLLGLATDIALASGLASQAADLIAQLPGPLRKLQQWQARAQLQNCMAAPQPTGAPDQACLQQAKERLLTQSSSSGG